MVLQNVMRFEFADEQPVRVLMKRLVEDHKLDEDEVVVTWVILAASGVVMTTYDTKEGADADLRTELGKGNLTIANVNGQLKVVSLLTSQTVATAEPNRPLTPMYRALVLRRNRNWWSFWKSWLEPRPGIPTQQQLGPKDEDAILGGPPSYALAQVSDDR
jgi:hypothetical protein